MTTMTEGLFPPADALGGLVEIPPNASPDHRRTLRRLQLLALGEHPITHLPVHPDAPADASRWDRYPRPFTCGTCVHRFVLDTGPKRRPKCDLLSAEDQAAQSAVTETFRWLPGCTAYRAVG